MSTGPIAPGRFAVVDIETSGLSNERHRLLQVAIVQVVDGTITDEWESLVKLRWPWQRVGPSEVHGIRRSTLRGAPRREQVLQQVADRLDGSVLVAHNVDFDWPFLERSARLDGIELPQRPSLCTLRLSRQLDPDRQLSHRLGDVVARYGVTNDRPHNALDDARATATVLPYLLRDHGVSSRADIDRLVTAQAPRNV